MMATVVPVLVEPYSVTLRFALDAFREALHNSRARLQNCD